VDEGPLWGERRAGKEVEVIYNPENPAEARINILAEVWSAPIFLWVDIEYSSSCRRLPWDRITGGKKAHFLSVTRIVLRAGRRSGGGGTLPPPRRRKREEGTEKAATYRREGAWM